MRNQQEQDKALLAEAYQDFNLVLAHTDGRPHEERQIAEKLRGLIQAHALTPVVFHSLRHSSTSVKLQISGGNIKAVQGDTGHVQARMVTDLYAHADTEDRRLLAQKVEEGFFQHNKPPAEVQDDTAEALRLLQENPNMAKLIIAALGQSSDS